MLLLIVIELDQRPEAEFCGIFIPLNSLYEGPPRAAQGRLG